MHQEWEYHILVIFEIVKDERLNELGRKGWELVNFQRDPNECITFVFKRPI